MARLMASDVNYYDDKETGSPDDVLSRLIRSIAQYCRSDSDVTKMYIGMASGDNAIPAMKRRYDEYKKSEGVNNMIAIYESDSQQNCRTVEDGLVAHFQEHEKNINRVGGGGGRHSSGPNYYVYLALQTPYVRYYDDKLQAGQPVNVLTSLKQSIAQYRQGNYDPAKMYIGIASDDDAVEAMMSAYDEYMQPEGINKIIAIYESGSERNCQNVIDKLVPHFKEWLKENNSSLKEGSKKCYVYLALRLLPAGQ